MRTKRKNYFCVLIILLVLIEIATIFLMYKSSNNKNTLLDNVSLKEQVSNMNGLAIMLEQSSGDYKESSNKAWPTEGYTFNKRMSKCIDNLGNKIENTLTYKNGLVYVETDNTSYCYVYFDIDRPATEELLATVPEEQLWDSTLEDDGYRYVGTNPDNYICFGTTDQEECMNDTDKYMYRIIGIFEDEEGQQHLKLIKKEALNTAYPWHSDNTTDTDWDESDLYKGINGSYFATNSEYSYMQDSAWNNLITTWEYTAANTKSYDNYIENGTYGPDYYYLTTRITYLHEMNRSTRTNYTCRTYDYEKWIEIDTSCESGEWKTVSSKIGLMYVSDYLLSLGFESLEYTNPNNHQQQKTGWMHIANNDSTQIENREWTIARYGDAIGNYDIWSLHSDGGVNSDYMNDLYVARPVFYLESDTKLDKGKGTIDNPYTIEISPNLREYCEEYNNINECIEKEENNIEDVKDLWNSTLEDDGIRYVGTNPNNYVCFGTTNTSECTSDTDKYMYRIIGIFEDEEGQQHLKLIKKEALNTAYAWHNSAWVEILWENSDLFTGINGNYFLNNTTYNYMQNNNWLSKIKEWNYIETNTKTDENYIVNNIHGPKYSNAIQVSSIYLHEMNRNTKSFVTCYYNESTLADCSIGEWKIIPTQIGLMYVSDYNLSLGKEALSYINDNSIHYASMKTGWIHLSNNDTSTLSTTKIVPPHSAEWTMSEFGKYSGGWFGAYNVLGAGNVGDYGVNNTYSVRPVFYLTENIKITSGKGSITEPFIIS